jgi:hypothetical protein
MRLAFSKVIVAAPNQFRERAHGLAGHGEKRVPVMQREVASSANFKHLAAPEHAAIRRGARPDATGRRPFQGFDVAFKRGFSWT